jgi:hypothetical protein
MYPYIHFNLESYFDTITVPKVFKEYPKRNKESKERPKEAGNGPYAQENIE